MKWEKLGWVWKPEGDVAWSKSHAALATVLMVSNDCWWLYLSTRDENGKSRVARLELDVSALPGKLPVVTHFDPTPIVSLGKPGTFDDSGAMPAWLVRNGDELRLFYTGWNVLATVPYDLAIGLAVSNDGGRTFQRYSDGPILGHSPTEPYFVCSPCVRLENGVWRMWYVASNGWQEVNGRWEPNYHIKYVESNDGYRWEPKGISCVDLGPDYAIARPCVFKHDGKYGMMYPYRSVVDYRTDRDRSYQFGYAESSDGIRWERMDDRVGIEKSAEGWDSEMIEYGWMQEHAGETYLIYNGNGFGRSGFGMARLVSWE